VLRPPTTDSRAWRADTLDDSPSWYLPLPACFQAALAETPADPPALVLPTGRRAECTAAVAPARAALQRGRGFVVIEAGETEQRLRPLYWLVGQALGNPVPQNVQGTLLYDVRDTGQDVYSGARFSVTSAESTFHTDGSFCDAVPEIVGLLCLRGARSGGVNHLVSGHAVHRRLVAEHAAILPILQAPFHVDRRGGVRPGEAPTARFPVLHADAERLTYRYLRHWIEAGHTKAGEPLTAAQREALDVLDGVLGDPALRAEFVLKPGDMLFISNRWILHNRTGFEDYPEPERRRHLVRLWLAGDARGPGSG
jgi:alpha-ketoglutarate-dependent taurine dioxygenase